MSLLKKIKQGSKNYKIIDFPGTEEKVAMITIPSGAYTDAHLKAEEIIQEKNITDEDIMSLEHQKQLAWYFLRDKDNREERIASNFDEFNEMINNSEVQYFSVQYSLFVGENSPFLNSVTEEQFEELKKTLEKITLNDLNGPSLVALRNFLMSLA